MPMAYVPVVNHCCWNNISIWGILYYMLAVSISVLILSIILQTDWIKVKNKILRFLKK